MSDLRTRWARVLTLVLASALLVVPGGKHLLICIEADGRIHLESGVEVCCDSDAPGAQADLALGVLAGAADDCGSCRDVLAGSAPARPNTLESVPSPDFDLCPDGGLGADTSHILPLPAADQPSLILASLQTIVIRC